MAVRIPSAFAKKIRFCPDTEGELKIENNKLVIIPIKVSLPANCPVIGVILTD
nr:hypothetical protein [Balnearium lithotrophicum]